MIVVKLPSQFDITAINRFTREIVGSNGTPNAQEFVFDFGALSFIDGTGYTVLSNTLQWLISQGVVCKFRNVGNLNRQAIAYLDDCGFFRKHMHRYLRPNATVRPSTLPCIDLAHASAHGWLEYKFTPWMRDVLNVSHAALDSVRTCVKEVFNNINDHSTLNTGFVHVQHYPNMRVVRITMSDFGAGIPTTIRRQFGDMSDQQAVLYATEEGVTSKSKPNNMGAGLCYLIDRVTADHGKVRIVSLGGNLYCCRGKNGQPERRKVAGNGVYPGTLVDIELDTRLFVGDEDERMDFEWSYEL